MLDVCWVGASPLYTAHCTPLYTVHQLLGTPPHPPLGTAQTEDVSMKWFSPHSIHIYNFYELIYPDSSQQV